MHQISDFHITFDSLMYQILMWYVRFDITHQILDCSDWYFVASEFDIDINLFDIDIKFDMNIKYLIDQIIKYFDVGILIQQPEIWLITYLMWWNRFVRGGIKVTSPWFQLQNTARNGVGIPNPNHYSKGSGDSHSKAPLKMERGNSLQNTTQNGVGIPTPKHYSKRSGNSHSKTQLKTEWESPLQITTPNGVGIPDPNNCSKRCGNPHSKTLLKTEWGFPLQNTTANGVGIPTPNHYSKGSGNSHSKTPLNMEWESPLQITTQNWVGILTPKTCLRMDKGFPLQNITQNGEGFLLPKHYSKRSGNSYSRAYQRETKNETNNKMWQRQHAPHSKSSRTDFRSNLCVTWVRTETRESVTVGNHAHSDGDGHCR